MARRIRTVRQGCSCPLEAALSGGVVRPRWQHGGFGASGGRSQPCEFVNSLRLGHLRLDSLRLALDEGRVARRQLQRNGWGAAEAAGKLRLQVVVDRLQRRLPRCLVSQSPCLLSWPLRRLFGSSSILGFLGDDIVDALTDAAPLVGE
eukprot:726476-Prymnesium_polylepis.1